MGKNKHDKLIDIISKDLKHRGYTDIYKNTEYSNLKCGEIDLYATKGKYVLVFEMKTNYNLKNYEKAKQQLNRAEKYYFSKHQKVFKFYVSNINNPYVEWIKKR